MSPRRVCAALVAVLSLLVIGALAGAGSAAADTRLTVRAVPSTTTPTNFLQVPIRVTLKDARPTKQRAVLLQKEAAGWRVVKIHKIRTAKFTWWYMPRPDTTGRYSVGVVNKRTQYLIRSSKPFTLRPFPGRTQPIQVSNISCKITGHDAATGTYEYVTGYTVTMASGERYVARDMVGKGTPGFGIWTMNGVAYDAPISAASDMVTACFGDIPAE